jgi:RelE toxin of RelE / RelB toxin-antitoxin system
LKYRTQFYILKEIAKRAWPDRSMRIFKNKWFVRFARKERITDAKLAEAVRNAEKGLIDADYGGGVIKQRGNDGGRI